MVKVTDIKWLEINILLNLLVLIVWNQTPFLKLLVPTDWKQTLLLKLLVTNDWKSTSRLNDAHKIFLEGHLQIKTKSNFFLTETPNFDNIFKSSVQTMPRYFVILKRLYYKL